jgi:hypothetical protein
MDHMEPYGIYIFYAVARSITSLILQFLPSQKRTPETLPTTNSSTTSTSRPSVIPLRIQLFRHSPILIVSALRDICSYDIVYCALEKTRSGSADIAGIERISMAIFDKRR